MYWLMPTPQWVPLLLTAVGFTTRKASLASEYSPKITVLPMPKKFLFTPSARCQKSESLLVLSAFTADRAGEFSDFISFGIFRQVGGGEPVLFAGREAFLEGLHTILLYGGSFALVPRLVQ